MVSDAIVFTLPSVDTFLFLFNDLMSSQMMKATTASTMKTVKTITTMVPVFKDFFSGIVDGYFGIVSGFGVIGFGAVVGGCVVVFVVGLCANVVDWMNFSDNFCSGIKS